MIKETEDKFRISDNIRLKIVSKSGYRLSSLVQNKNPPSKNCGRIDCKLCETTAKNGMGKSLCNVNSVCYQAKCVTCEDAGKIKTYDGETARTAYIRSLEHYEDLKSKKNSSWMWKHINSDHDGNINDVEFSWKVTKVSKKPLQRQLYEAVKINNKHNEENLNSKNEYNGQRLRKLEVNRDIHFDCKVCGQLFATFQHKKTHTQMFHERIKCKQCVYEAFGESGLKEHRRTTHQMRT